MNNLIEIRQIFRRFGENPALFTKLLWVPTLTHKQITEQIGGGGGAVIYENMVHHNFAIFLQ